MECIAEILIRISILMRSITSIPGLTEQEATGTQQHILLIEFITESNIEWDIELNSKLGIKLKVEFDTEKSTSKRKHFNSATDNSLNVSCYMPWETQQPDYYYILVHHKRYRQRKHYVPNYVEYPRDMVGKL
uniref:Uncharacterized protein n=1 Tax=Glossina austeni TaxID=7395 RepID=A0A1A9UH60_GLOAU